MQEMAPTLSQSSDLTEATHVTFMILCVTLDDIIILKMACLPMADRSKSYKDSKVIARWSGAQGAHVLLQLGLFHGKECLFYFIHLHAS